MEIASQTNTLNPASAFGIHGSPYIAKQEGINWESSQEQNFEANLKNSEISKISWFWGLESELIEQEGDFPLIRFSDLILENKNEFKKLIQSRINYLNSLRNLKDTWISGPCQIPSSTSLENCNIILSTFFKIYSDHFAQSLFIPKIVMGPIPSGGVSIELQIADYTNLYFSVFNDGKVDEYIDINGHYHEIVEEGYLDQIDFPILIQQYG